jgi:tRNA1(Val) A37 N6-methylase TrmN6
VPVAAGQRVLDIGCGTGAATLCLAARVPLCEVVGLELQPDLVRVAAENAALNGVSERVAVLAGDLLRPLPSLRAGSFDHVMANPPFVERGRGTSSSTPAKIAATMEGEADLAAWVGFALTMVRSKGSMTFIHRADRVDALIAALVGGAGEISVFPLWPAAGRAANRVLIRARKQIKAPARLLPGLVLHGADGSFTPAAEAVLRGAAALDFGP